METVKTYNFLILEDNPADAKLISREIAKVWEGALIRVLSKPGEFRTALAEIEWDIVISDYSLPKFTGLDALRMVKESDQDPHFFLISGIIGEERAAEVMQAGARDFIDKHNPGRLIISIKRAIKEASGRKELRLTRSELLKSEKKYKDIVSLAPVGYYQSSLEGKYLDANQSLAEMLGYDDTDDFINNNSLKDIYFDHRDRERLLSDCQRQGKHRLDEVEVRFKRKDGSPVWVMLTSQAVKDMEDNVRYYNGFVVDISQQKLAESRLQKMVSHWENTFNAMTDIVMMISIDHRILEINDAGCRALGLSREKITGEYCYRIVHNTDSIPDFCPTHKALLSKKMEIAEYEENGKFYQLTAWPILNNDQEVTGFSHSIKDITKNKEYEKELKVYREQLENLVKERTKELEQVNRDLAETNTDLKNMQKLFIGREYRIKDLRDQVNELKSQIKQLKKKSNQ